MYFLLYIWLFLQIINWIYINCIVVKPDHAFDSEFRIDCYYDLRYTLHIKINSI